MARASWIGVERLVELAPRYQRVADLDVRCRQVVLPLQIGRVGGGETFGDRQAVAVGFERGIELALLHQHVADLGVRHPQVALPLCIGAIGSGEALGDGKTVLVDFERLLQVPDREIGVAELVQHHRAASLQVRIIGGGGCELLEGRLGGLQNLAHRFDGHALHVAQPLRDV